MRITRLASLAVGLTVVLAGCANQAARQAGGAGEAQAASSHQLSRATDAVISTAQSRLRSSATDWQAMDTLGGAYLQKVREVGDPGYYPKVEALLRQALAHDPGDGQALTLMGSLALARHQFRDALTWGQKAHAALPYSAPPLGVIVDADTQLGDYPAALAACQQMVDTKPDLSSYARVSYLRELNGDIPGAISAMRMAVEAGGPVPENVAYTRMLLGTLYLNSGYPEQAATQYQQTLSEDPGYAPAIAGMGRVRAAEGREAEAISLLKQAVQMYPQPDSVITLGDLYAVTGDTRQARQTYDLARAEISLYQANGVDLDAELALFELDHAGDLAAAAASAEQAMRDRPSVVTEDTVAWARYRRGDVQGAVQASRDALRLGTRDALFHYHAGVIEEAAGMSSAARTEFATALAINPHFSLLYTQDATARLRALGGAA